MTGWAARARELAAVPRLHGAPSPTSKRLAWRVPGRKLQQVAAFAGGVGSLLPRETRIVDWCAGKGYLGRHLALEGGHRVVCVEQSPALCDAGRRLDRRAGADCRWLCEDIHGPRAAEALRGAVAVALHACGELHRELVRRGVEVGARALALAPCCYHREAHKVRPPAPAEPWRLTLPPPPAPFRYLPLSAGAGGADPGLDEHALRLATSSEVVARPRIVRQRELEQVYRLGVDLLLREATGQDRYHPLPPLPARWYREGLSRFVERVARAVELQLPRGGLDRIEEQARKKLRRARALGLVRGLFRRPVELWLALDVAGYLEEHGYRVRLGAFCDEAVTPRNLAIVAAAS
jgi:hypothetical protein